MSANKEFCGACRQVIVRTYREMRAHGQDDPEAFQVALNVLVLRHPGRRIDACASDAARWISDAVDG
jgi:hypothetical protein